jgi:hypothetical protein
MGNVSWTVCRLSSTGSLDLWWLVDRLDICWRSSEVTGVQPKQAGIPCYSYYSCSFTIHLININMVQRVFSDQGSRNRSCRSCLDKSRGGHRGHRNKPRILWQDKPALNDQQFVVLVIALSAGINWIACPHTYIYIYSFMWFTFRLLCFSLLYFIL